jgi:DNA repair protein RecO (recombination protein O)
MRQLITQGIILSRTDFGEADRIITILTPDHGKLRLMAKGVRRAKSKLAGGIELFSVSDITFIRGRGDIGTLVSTRLQKHYGNIVHSIDRTMAGYDFIKLLNKTTEDEPGEEYFVLLRETFESLDDASIDLQIVWMWFYMQLLQLAGYAPNLQTDTSGAKLAADQTYLFSFDDMTFVARPGAPFHAEHIKLLRLGFSGQPPRVLQQIQGIQQLLTECLQLVKTLQTTHIRI